MPTKNTPKSSHRRLDGTPVDVEGDYIRPLELRAQNLREKIAEWDGVLILDKSLSEAYCSAVREVIKALKTVLDVTHDELLDTTIHFANIPV